MRGLLLGTLLLPLSLGLSVGACGDTACERLAEYCPQCANSAYRTQCEQLVQDEIEGVCDAQTPTFKQICVGSSTGGGATTTTPPTGGTGGTGTTSIGGAGGGLGGAGATGGVGVGGAGG